MLVASTSLKRLAVAALVLVVYCDALVLRNTSVPEASDGLVWKITVTNNSEAPALEHAPVANTSEALVMTNTSVINKDRISVWIHAFARSGSSTILSLVSETDGQLIQDNKMVSRAFTLFEPCHAEDDLAPELATKGCAGMLQSLARCDFSGIRRLHGWNDIHSKRRGVSDYTPEMASSACSSAELVAFKTISKAFEKFVIKDEALALLEQDDRLHMLDVIRDPRSIYSSWMTTFPFNDTNVGGMGRDVSALLDICDTYAANIKVKHSRVHRIKFEALVKNPLKVTQDTYADLGLKFGKAQAAWVQKTFDAKECPGVDHWNAAYSDCHIQSNKTLERWLTVMTQDEKDTFNGHANCRLVAETYGYPFTAPDYMNETDA